MNHQYQVRPPMGVSPEYVLTAEDFIYIINQEIAWCEENGDKPNLTVQQEWFVEGLKQARNLIASAVFAMEMQNDK